MKVALIGAGGKMGRRITANLRHLPQYQMAYVEISEPARASLREQGIQTISQSEALAGAKAVILAVPDALIGAASQEVVPQMESDSVLIGLDPAAGYAGVFPVREDVTFFAAHPCHPPLFHEEYTPEAQRDWFGGIAARQSVVCALISGSEENYQLGEAIAADMYAPILRMHRISIEQMAILEPGVVETTCATLITTMREALEHCIEMGVPEAAAWDFVLGHIRVELAIVFGFAGFPFSDGAKLAIENAKQKILQPAWKDNVLSLPAVQQQVQDITQHK